MYDFLGLGERWIRDFGPFLRAWLPKLGLMNTLPLQFLMMIFAGWVNRHQQEVIGYLQEENRALRDQLGGKRLRFTDQQRRRLAVKAKAVGRKGLFELDTLVSPDTLLRWPTRTLVRATPESEERSTTWAMRSVETRSKGSLSTTGSIP
jgi:hypothetical protein